MDNLISASTNYQHIQNIDSIKDAMDKISEANRARRNAKTKPENVKVRQGKGGRKFFYINRQQAQQWLDTNYPLWSVKVGEIHIIEDMYEGEQSTGSYNIPVELTVADPATGITRVIECVGTKEFIINKYNNKSYQQYIKAAETDGLKRCVFTLGGFGDVYSPDEEIEELTDIDLLVSASEELIPMAVKAFKLKRISEADYRVILSKLANMKLDKDTVIKWKKALGE